MPIVVLRYQTFQQIDKIAIAVISATPGIVFRSLNCLLKILSESIISIIFCDLSEIFYLSK